MTFATAGHPPPVLRLPDGQIRLSTPPTHDHRRRGHTERRRSRGLSVGSQLVMFTDGLVERRDRPFDVGIAQLAGVLAALRTMSPHMSSLTCAPNADRAP